MTKHNHSTVEIVLNPLFRTLSVQLPADKMGMKPNCICVSVCVGVSSVWTVLHITIRSIVISDVVGNGDGDGIGQCEHTINANLKSNMFTTATLADPRGCPSPPPTKIFLISCSFGENLENLYVGAPCRVGTPPTGYPASAPVPTNEVWGKVM